MKHEGIPRGTGVHTGHITHGLEKPARNQSGDLTRCGRVKNPSPGPERAGLVSQQKNFVPPPYAGSTSKEHSRTVNHPRPRFADA